MGGRGASSGRSKPSINYEPYKRGQITKYEAGVIYRASKDNKIKIRPETTKELYNEVDLNLKYATERYQRDGRYYDDVYRITSAIKSEDYKKAQNLIDDWEKERIKRASKKSIWYKYQK